ncbi:PQQ-dependent sugar dehydrogenase [Anaerobaca lacustris]|uniref:PQQ-dependent sugar dehydrogenase n=1 Tax=Anaerobaca lacustris TaxID=3044600 RepID=A0AAW6TYX8_9BACT|nr:PQQ-dependent sugar dehydrogenase [Sedimentisphaerales bacterium M17dextr]
MQRLVVVLSLAVLLPPVTAYAVCPLRLEMVASGLNRPVGVAWPDDGTNRLFVIEQHTGRIRIVDLNTGSMLPAPFLSLGGLVSGNEQGLLGLAFDPLHANNGLFYVNVTVAGGATEIRRYRVSRTSWDVADPDSGVVLLSIAQPFSNHNGGWIAFGPDGYLYISTGDGGSGFDPGNRAQNLDTLLGKMLRIDVRATDGPTGQYGIPPDNPFVGVPGARPEIWAYGLRNAWRCSFDRLTGDLYIADVGQNQIEEINFQPASSSGGENYGWRIMEGTRCSDDSRTGGNPPCDDPSLVPPIYEYTHAVGVSVTGGYVYRGHKLGGLQGTYFFGDYGSARIWSFRYDGATLTEFAERTAELNPGLANVGFLSSFGEGPDGELYLLDLVGGALFRMVSAAEPIPGDLNNDCRVDLADLAILAGNWLAGAQ